jgi:RimJ/RimL family protein N-acetyltransferase
MASSREHDFPRIQTTRLTLRQFEQRDLAELLAYRNDTDVEHWQGWGLYDEARGWQLIEEFISCPFGALGERSAQVAFELRSTGRLVGDAMLQISAVDASTATIGYTIAPAYQRRGLAREGVGALLGYAIPVLNLTRVQATTLADNVASIALLMSMGFELCDGAPPGEQRFCLDEPQRLSELVQR